MERCTAIERLDLGGLPHNESGQPMLDLLVGASCPALLTGGADIKRLLNSWSRWRYVRDSAAAGISVDWMREGVDTFTYWDNDSVLAKKLGSPPDHNKVQSEGAHFIDAVRMHPGVARFGGPVHRFSEGLARDIAGPLFAPPAQSEAARHLTFFASARGITCAAHFDNLVNIHLVVLGKKRIRLAPPAAAFDLLTRPGAHPSSRQARCSLASPIAAPCSYEGPVLEANLSRGEAIFIPSGWFHEFAALEPSVALSATANVPEWIDFNKWASTERREMIPFVTKESLAKPWTPQRFASTLMVFVPALLVALGLIDDAPGSDLASGRYLRRTFLRQYNSETRREAGLIWPPGKARPWKCSAADGRDAETAHSAAQSAANRFLTRYRRDLMPIYVSLYLENILSFVAPKYSDRGIEARFAALIEFVEVCLAPTETQSVVQEKSEL